MPSTACSIMEETLLKYPELRAFINSEPPNISLLKEALAYHYRLSEALFGQKMTVFQVCSYFNKVSHLQALSYNEETVKANYYKSIRLAALNGHTETIKYLESHLTEAERKKAVKADYYSAIRFAAQNGHTETIKYLESHLTEAERKKAVKADNYSAIRFAAKNGYTETIKYLESHLTKAEQKKAVKADYYSAIRFAAKNGYTETIKYLESHLTEAERKEAVKADNYSAIRFAAKNGHTETIKYLESHLTEAERKEAVKADNYDAIRFAAKNGHTETIKYLESHLTEAERKEAVKAYNYFAIRLAALNGHTETIKYLESHLTKAERKKAVKTDNYDAIRFAAQNGHTDTVNHFLTIGAGLAYAEPHDHEYGRFVHPFIAHQINAYQHAKNEYEQTNPNGVFNLDEQEARLCFYMLRNLIRRGVDREHAAAEDVTDEIRMLLSIPSVRALCHLPMSDEGGENELLRLAIRIGNQEASSLLLQLPEVRRVAEQHNFYENEGDGTLDLRQMAQDKESSMVALSVSEREVVNQLKQHYQGKINELGGHTQAFASLKNELKKRYEANPTTLELVDRYGKKHTQMLPFEWDEFQQLKEGLSKEQYKNALIAYH